MFMGILYLFLTFLFCFILVHLIKLAIIGLSSLKKQPAAEEKKPTQPKTEPVYYIVEKKRARKANYSEPKRIEFKDKNQSS